MRGITLSRDVLLLLCFQLISSINCASAQQSQSITPSSQAGAGSGSISTHPGPTNVSSQVTVIDSTALSTQQNLNIASGHTLLINFSKSDAVNVPGSIVNNGSIYAFSNNTLNSAATFAASNITNNQGATISTIIPASLLNTVGVTHALSLQLIASGNISNFGIINSANNLSMIAGGQIINALPAGVSGTAPVMQALNNINIVSMTGQIINSGSISAVGNINVSNVLNAQIASTLQQSASVQTILSNVLNASLNSATSSQLLANTSSVLTSIDNTGGLISSATGNINIGVDAVTSISTTIQDTSAGFIAISNEGGQILAPVGSINVGSARTSTNIELSGGEVQALSINFTAPSGIIDSHADRYIGIINASADAAYIGAASGQLDLGIICLKGDPYYYNDKGSVVLHGTLTANERISIYSAGSITGDISLISAPEIWMEAGVSITPPPPKGHFVGKVFVPDNPADPRTVNGNRFTDQFLIISGPNGAAGDIKFTGDGMQIQTSGPGGFVEMIAHNGSIAIPTNATISSSYIYMKSDGSIDINSGAKLQSPNHIQDGLSAFILNANGGTFTLADGASIVTPIGGYITASKDVIINGKIDPVTVGFSSGSGNYQFGASSELKATYVLIDDKLAANVPAKITNDGKFEVGQVQTYYDANGNSISLELAGGGTYQSAGSGSFSADSVGLTLSGGTFTADALMFTSHKEVTVSNATLQTKSITFSGTTVDWQPGAKIQIEQDGHVNVTADEFKFSGSQNFSADMQIKNFTPGADLKLEPVSGAQLSADAFYIAADGDLSLSGISNFGASPLQISVANKITSSADALVSGPLQIWFSDGSAASLPSNITAADSIAVDSASSLQFVRSSTLNSPNTYISAQDVGLASNVALSNSTGPISFSASTFTAESGSRITAASVAINVSDGISFGDNVSLRANDAMGYGLQFAGDKLFAGKDLNLFSNSQMSLYAVTDVAVDTGLRVNAGSDFLLAGSSVNIGANANIIAGGFISAHADNQLTLGPNLVIINSGPLAQFVSLDAGIDTSTTIANILVSSGTITAPEVDLYVTGNEVNLKFAANVFSSGAVIIAAEANSKASIVLGSPSLAGTNVDIQAIAYSDAGQSAIKIQPSSSINSTSSLSISGPQLLIEQNASLIAQKLQVDITQTIEVQDGASIAITGDAKLSAGTDFRISSAFLAAFAMKLEAGTAGTGSIFITDSFLTGTKDSSMTATGAIGFDRSGLQQHFLDISAPAIIFDKLTLAEGSQFKFSGSYAGLLSSSAPMLLTLDGSVNGKSVSPVTVSGSALVNGSAFLTVLVGVSPTAPAKAAAPPATPSPDLGLPSIGAVATIPVSQSSTIASTDVVPNRFPVDQAGDNAANDSPQDGVASREQEPDGLNGTLTSVKIPTTTGTQDLKNAWKIGSGVAAVAVAGPELLGVAAGEVVGTAAIFTTITAGSKLIGAVKNINDGINNGDKEKGEAPKKAAEVAENFSNVAEVLKDVSELSLTESMKMARDKLVDSIAELFQPVDADNDYKNPLIPVPSLGPIPSKLPGPQMPELAQPPGLNQRQPNANSTPGFASIKPTNTGNHLLNIMNGFINNLSPEGLPTSGVWDSPSHYVPVAYVSSASRFSSILIHPEKDQQIIHGAGATIRVAKGAVVAVAFTDRSLAVLNLHDEHAGSVAICGDQFTIDVPPGQQLVIGESAEADIRTVQPIAKLPLRKEQIISSIGNVHMYKSEFSHAVCMTKVPPVQCLRNSSDAAEKRAMRKMQKTAAALQMVTARRGAYR